jgi:hypothetical protein
MKYPNKSLEIPLETFSKVAPEKLLWTMYRGIDLVHFPHFCSGVGQSAKGARRRSPTAGGCR